MADLPTAYAVALKNARPPLNPESKNIDGWTRIGPYSGWSCSKGCNAYAKQASSLIFLADNGIWNHYSFRFVSSNNILNLSCI